MFGTALPEDEVINVGIGKSLNVSKSPFGYIKPDTTFKEELKINISGINIELYHAPGETNDQLFVWLPEHDRYLEIISIKHFRTSIRSENNSQRCYRLDLLR